ncbi:UNVERIFIED_CONTAM: hypothetical protein Sradi_4891600 [Sesamum radiatum]|uniref:Uncharacterized protein n=1 Tax=Sesamum radiatum TaxID=300843 RepID=A0AAW2MDX6_SESRA
MSILGRSLQDNLGKLQFGRHSYRLNTHSFCGLDYGKSWQHGTDLSSYRRIHRAHCALTVMNRPNISSSIAPSVLMFGLISDSGLASPVVCQPFSVQSSGLRKGRLAPLCGTKARHLALACIVYSL